jgi:hypothetical protein
MSSLRPSLRKQNTTHVFHESFLGRNGRPIVKMMLREVDLWDRGLVLYL